MIFSVKPNNERVQPPPISPEDYRYFIGYLLSKNWTSMLDFDCKEGDCKIRIIANEILLQILNTFKQKPSPMRSCFWKTEVPGALEMVRIKAIKRDNVVSIPMSP